MEPIRTRPGNEPGVAMILTILLPVLLAIAPWVALAGSTDLTLFGASGGNAPPNIMILIDTSSSMKKRPSGCTSCDP